MVRPGVKNLQTAKLNNTGLTSGKPAVNLVASSRGMQMSRSSDDLVIVKKIYSLKKKTSNEGYVEMPRQKKR